MSLSSALARVARNSPTTDGTAPARSRSDPATRIGRVLANIGLAARTRAAARPLQTGGDAIGHDQKESRSSGTRPTAAGTEHKEPRNHRRHSCPRDLRHELVAPACPGSRCPRRSLGLGRSTGPRSMAPFGRARASRSGAAESRLSDSSAVAGARRNAVAPSPGLTRLDLGGGASGHRRGGDRILTSAFSRKRSLGDSTGPRRDSSTAGAGSPLIASVRARR